QSYQSLINSAEIYSGFRAVCDVVRKDEPGMSVEILSQHSLARILVGFAVVTAVVNVVLLAPQLSLHENHYVFNPQGHMYGGGGHHHHNNIHHGNVTTSKLQNAAAAPLQQQASSQNINERRAAFTEEEGRQYMLDIFQEAGVTLTPEMEAELPKWKDVRQVVGDFPRVLNLESCATFRENTPPLERMLGSAGMFNTGTNLVTHLLKQNCEIPERREKEGPKKSKESYGMRWQVPWGKHTPAKFRLEHATTKASAIKKEYILPVVTTRHPYTWFKSMCKNGYTAKWDHHKTGKDGMTLKCPNLKVGGGSDNKVWNPVTVTFAEKREDHHLSLAHLWNDWYSYYVDQADYPFVVVRMEDLVFYPKETTQIICECAGGRIQTDRDSFGFIVDSAKADSPGHDKSTGIFAAWVKYSKQPGPKYGLSGSDYASAKEALNGKLMERLGYEHPPAN
ncbi:MAG: hypothetical protein SGILL_008049, partial [Bacillariaceae sp.]